MIDTLPTSEFVDTNILVYAHDPRDTTKQARAKQLLTHLVDTNRLAVSVQVLNEFYVAATRTNRSPGLSHEEAAAIVLDTIILANVIPITTTVTGRALEAVVTHGTLSME